MRTSVLSHGGSPSFMYGLGFLIRLIRARQSWPASRMRTLIQRVSSSPNVSNASSFENTTS